MGEKLAFCLSLIRLKGGIEDRLKVGQGCGRRGGRSIGVSLGHGSC